MASSAEDTQHEIGRLRADAQSALSELEHRLRGGFGSIAVTEARISGMRAGQSAVSSARDNPTALSVGGVVLIAAIGFAAYTAVDRWRESRRPANRLASRLREARGEVEGRFERGRRRLERALPRDVLLTTDRSDGRDIRVTGARIERRDAKGGVQDVLKKVLWGGLLSVFVAMSSVMARRVAASVWRTSLGEDPPTEKPHD